jgi:hypothetical protein
MSSNRDSPFQLGRSELSNIERAKSLSIQKLRSDNKALERRNRQMAKHLNKIKEKLTETSRALNKANAMLIQSRANRNSTPIKENSTVDEQQQPGKGLTDAENLNPQILESPQASQPQRRVQLIGLSPSTNSIRRKSTPARSQKPGRAFVLDEPTEQQPTQSIWSDNEPTSPTTSKSPFTSPTPLPKRERSARLQSRPRLLLKEPSLGRKVRKGHVFFNTVAEETATEGLAPKNKGEPVAKKGLGSDMQELAHKEIEQEEHVSEREAKGVASSTSHTTHGSGGRSSKTRSNKQASKKGRKSAVAKEDQEHWQQEQDAEENLPVFSSLASVRRRRSGSGRL